MLKNAKCKMKSNSAVSSCIFSIFLSCCFKGCQNKTYRDEPVPLSSIFTTGLLGDRCRNNITCQLIYPNSYCQSIPSSDGATESDGVCTCNDEELYVSSSDRKRCLKGYLEMGSSCEDHSQCRLYAGKQRSAVCVPGSGICDCAPGFFPSDDLIYCWRIINKLGTQTCVDHLQCQLGEPGKLSHCVEIDRDRKGTKKVCKCQNGAVSGAGDNKCFPVANYVGDACQIHAQCMAGLKYARCVEGQCECNRGYEVRQSEDFNICLPVENTL